MNLNKVFILGRLTDAPQLRSTPTGQSVASFSVATNRVWSDKAGARQEETEYHNIVVWGRQAEIASQFLVKGSLVLVEGRMRTRSWTDKQGQARKTTEIICDRMQLGPRPLGGDAQSVRRPSQNDFMPSTPTPSDSDIPTVDVEEEPKQDDLPF